MKTGQRTAAFLLITGLLSLPGCITFESDVLARQTDPKPAAGRGPTLVTQTDSAPLATATGQSNFERTSSK